MSQNANSTYHAYGTGGTGGKSTLGATGGRRDKGEYDNNSYFPPSDYLDEDREFSGQDNNNYGRDGEELGGEDNEEEGPEGEDDEAYDSLFQGTGPTLSQKIN